MTEQESIRIITEMIEAARSRIRRGEGNIAMFWGAVVMVASLAHFTLHQAGYPAEGAYAWLLIFVGAAYNIWFAATQQTQDRTKTHIDRILDHLWLGFGICMIVVGMLGSQMGYVSFSVIELFYGLSLFVSGAAFRFRPLIIGGIGCWLAAVLMPFLEYPYHLLVLAVSVLGYILPGWLLNRKAHV